MPRMLAFSTMGAAERFPLPGRKHVTFVKVIIVLLRMVYSYDIQDAFQGEIIVVPFQVIQNHLDR